jgi:hypothetical protein
LHLDRRMADRRKGLPTAIAGIALVMAVWTVRAAPISPSQATQATTHPKPIHDDERIVSDEERLETFTRAQVWMTPKVPIEEAVLGEERRPGTEVSCRFKITALGGTTPKFDCDVDSGDEIRVKYGNGPEIPAEAAATRLLRALGFGADDISVVEKLRCHGCPKEPFSTMKMIEMTRAEPLYRRLIDYNDYEDFEWVAIERKYSARPIETAALEGWAFHELDKVNPAKGGASRAHVDALRLIAVLLAHWDNKPENQRMVCLTDEWPEKTRCPRPFLLLQDVGATFGPTKVDLAEWQKVRMWEDRPACKVSMRELPYEGATFGAAHVTEAGRLFAGKLLSRLSDRQLADLFTGARFDQRRGWFSAYRPVTEWVAAFKAKVATINEGAPCPQ